MNDESKITAFDPAWRWPNDSRPFTPGSAVQFSIDDIVVMTLDEGMSHIATRLDIDGVERKYALSRLEER